MIAVFNHALMEIAREAAGLSQEDLATEISCTQATISRWEHGLFKPSVEEIERLATILRVPASFFQREESPLRGGLPVFYHRSLTAAPPRQTSRINARCFMRVMQMQALCKLCPPVEHEFPEMPADAFQGGVPAVAAALRATWRLGPGPVPNLVGLLEARGGVVIVEDLGCDAVDALCWWHPGLPKLFFVNARKPACRMRFSLAHELGHTIMHTAPTDPARAEPEADRFAGEFLFPGREAKAVLCRPLTLARLAALKPWWQMSMAAIALRAKESGAITADDLSVLMRDMGSRGWRKREPVEIPHEQPSRFARMLRYPLTALGWTVDQLAAALFTTSDELEEMLGNHLAVESESRESDAPAERPWLRLVGS